MTRTTDLSRRLQDRLTTDRLLVVVAGPNGAGKSMFVDRFLRPTGIRVINPDQIARALAPDDPGTMAYEAAQAADSVRHDHNSIGFRSGLYGGKYQSCAPVASIRSRTPST